MTSESISWKKIGCNLSKDSLTALKKLKFTRPTPIQVHAIPTFLAKKDIVAQAVTGSGKTLSFIIPIMELLSKATDLKRTDIFSVILSPTSELANQTREMFNQFLSHYGGAKPRVVLFKKGEESATEGETTDEKGVILISTPGGLSKAIEDTTVNATMTKSLKRLEVLVLDEADRLLEMGFSAQLHTIIKGVPKQRLTALFSATQSTEVEDLVRTGLRNPVRVSVKVTKGLEAGLNDTIPSGLTNYYMNVECEKKIDLLVHFLRLHKDKKVLVFFATCASVDYFHRILTSILKKHTILCIHRKLKAKRNALFQQFKELERGVMLCTDLMARGVDVPNIDWVVQVDPPKCATNFVHRCGRTARGAAEGQSLLFVLPNESVYLNFLTQNQHVQIDEYSPEWTVESLEPLHTRMQAICAKDRLVYEKSVRAFVAFVEYYKKHELKYVFKLKDLDLGRLANGFGLLRLPQMREFNGVDTTGFRSAEVDLSTLVYKDKSLRVIKDKTRVLKKERREAKEAEEKEAQKATGGDKKDEETGKTRRAVKKTRRAAKGDGQKLVQSVAEPMEVEMASPKTASKKRNATPTATGSGLLSFAKKSKLK